MSKLDSNSYTRSGRKQYLKVILPERKGKYQKGAEGIWVEIIALNPYEGYGIARMANQPTAAVDWVTIGDYVIIQELDPDHKYYVINKTNLR